MTRRRVLVLLVALALGLLSTLALPAGAHTSVRISEPAAASTVDAPVREIVVTFFHEVRPTPQIAVQGPAGAVDSVGAPVLLAGNTAIRQGIEPISIPGEYVVEIDFVSSDGDVQQTAFSFDVRAVPNEIAGAGALLPIDLDLIRLFVHVLAAMVWVGGQLTLGGLVSTLRTVSADAPGIVARRFDRIAWPAFAVLVLTGLWNLAEVSLSARPSSYRATLFLKLAFVGASGASAAVHRSATSKKWLAIGGALALFGGLGAVFTGLQLAFAS